MQTSLNMLATLIGAGILTGCASSPQISDFKIVPKMYVRHSDDSADGYYKLGRYYHGAQRFGEAASSYRRALALDKNHVAARSALGILLTETGQSTQGVALLREAIEAAPRDSQLFNNLGYALLLAGDVNGAAAALNQATLLDPGNMRAWNNYGRVMEKLGQPKQAQALFDRARSLAKSAASPAQAQPAGDVDRQPVLGPGPESPEHTRGKGSLEKQPHSEMRTEIRQVGPNVYELRQLAHHVAGGTLSAATTPVPQEPGSKPAAAAGMPSRVHLLSSKAAPHIEISNGNGITGMARLLGKLVANGYTLPVRVTNQNTFNVKTTCIEYSNDHKEAAHALAADLGGSIRIQTSNNLPKPGVRLILGKDIRSLDALRAYFSKGKATDGGGANQG